MQRMTAYYLKGTVEMIARYEQSALSGQVKVSVQKYKGLQNLPHWHMESELIFADKGTAEVMAENTIYTLSENGCIFIRSGAVHYIKAESDSIISVMKIDSGLIASAVGEQTLVCPVLEYSCCAANAFEKIKREISEGKKYYEIICGSTAIVLIAEIFRNEKTVPARQEAENAKYKELLGLIANRYADITFDEAAEFMCFSKPYFSKYFRKMSGMTFSEYVNVVRVSEAIKMISHGNNSIGEAALSAGFGTIRSFNRIFKRLTGFAPRELPEDFIFIRSSFENSSDSFDPTLSTSELL